MIKDTAMVGLSTLKEIHMKVNGSLINLTVKAHIKIELIKENISENGKTARKLAEEWKCTKMDLFMTESSIKIRKKGWENISS